MENGGGGGWREDIRKDGEGGRGMNDKGEKTKSLHETEEVEEEGVERRRRDKGRKRGQQE